MPKEMLALYSADNLPHLLVKSGGQYTRIHCARCGLEWTHGDNYQAIEGWSWVREEDKDPYSSTSPEYSLVHIPGAQIWDPCKPRTWYVNMYEMGREYGGPEEGGWYYDTWKALETTEVPTYGFGQMLRNALLDEYELPTFRRWSTQYKHDEYDYRLEEHEAKDGDSYRPWC